MSLADEVRRNPSLVGEDALARDAGAEAPEEPIVVTPIPPIEEVIVLVPALDEERGIGLVLDNIPIKALQDMGCEVSILVVDGLSGDSTREIAERKGAHVFVQSGEGKGNGVRQAFRLIMRHQSQFLGFEHQQCVIMLDADGTYPPDAIPRIVEALRAGNDVVMGSRLRGRIEDGAMSNLNKMGNRILSRIAQTLFGVRVTDVCTGMWGFSQDFLEECELQSKGFELEAEMFANAALLGANIAEVPIEYHLRLGEPKMIPLRTGLKIAACLVLKRVGGYRTRPPRMWLQAMLGRGIRDADLRSDT